MKGYKGQLFVLYLSFFGWAILSILTFGVLAFFYTDLYLRQSLVEFKEKVSKLTDDLFWVKITYSEELAVEKIYLPYGEISIQLFYDIKFEKKGIINYIIENHEIK